MLIVGEGKSVRVATQRGIVIIIIISIIIIYIYLAIIIYDYYIYIDDNDYHLPIVIIHHNIALLLP